MNTVGGTHEETVVLEASLESERDCVGAIRKEIRSQFGTVSCNSPAALRRVRGGGGIAKPPRKGIRQLAIGVVCRCHSLLPTKGYKCFEPLSPNMREGNTQEPIPTHENTASRRQYSPMAGHQCRPGKTQMD